MKKLRVVKIASLAAANPEMVRKDRRKPSRCRFNFGDGPSNTERSYNYDNCNAV